ncbi:hypothetical protein AAG906_013195 [Vitis piasezkii]
MNLRVQTRYPLFREVIRINFLKSLSKILKCNITAYENYHRSDPKEPLRVYVLFQHIQKMVSSETAVIAETRDSWFNCQKLKLPRDADMSSNCNTDQLVVLRDSARYLYNYPLRAGKAYLEEYVNPCAYLSRKSLWGIALPLGLAKSVSQVDNMASLSGDIFCDILKHFDGDPALTSATHACAFSGLCLGRLMNLLEGVSRPIIILKIPEFLVMLQLVNKDGQVEGVTPGKRDIKEFPVVSIEVESVNKEQHSEIILDENPRTTNSEV